MRAAGNAGQAGASNGRPLLERAKVWLSWALFSSLVVVGLLKLLPRFENRLSGDPVARVGQPVSAEVGSVRRRGGLGSVRVGALASPCWQRVTARDGMIRSEWGLGEVEEAGM